MNQYDENVIYDLLKRYRSGKCTSEERALIETWYLKQLESDAEPLPELDLETKRDIFLQGILSQLPEQSKVISLWKRMLVAATTVVSIGLGAYYFGWQRRSFEQQEIINKIQPGTVSATLTLSNGQKIVLAQSANGQIAQQSGVVVNKQSNGQINYEIQAGQSVDSTQLNTLSTNKGETYKVLLPDGTAVWINSESSITYPANFASAKQRHVQLSGEAYFEVVKDKAHPFMVETGGQMTRVIGTHFNIHSYKDESLSLTTLLQGSVQVSNDHAKAIIKPGQQVQTQDGAIKVLDGVDTEEAVAWKNGYFKFNGNLENAMNKIARWYDIQVEYKTQPNMNLVLEGEVSRSRKISEVLKLLEKYAGDVHFQMDGRKVIVTK